MGLINQLISARHSRTANSLNLPYSISIESLSDSDKYVRRQDIIRVDKFNEDVKNWSKSATQKLRGSIRSMIDNDKTLSKSLKGKVYHDRQYAKEANRIGFSFAREGIYAHKGAGKGQGGTIGSQWYNLKGEQKSTQLSSLMKMDTGNRKAKEWFDSTIENELPQLADLASDYSASLVLDTTTLYIN